MRDMNGIDFLKFIRKSGNSTPFVLLTGVQNPEIETEADECGAVYVPKGEHPVEHLDEIVTILRKIKKEGTE